MYHWLVARCLGRVGRVLAREFRHWPTPHTLLVLPEGVNAGALGLPGLGIAHSPAHLAALPPGTNADGVLAGMALHGLAPQAGLALLARLKTHTPCLVADFCQAERNLHTPATALLDALLGVTPQAAAHAVYKAHGALEGLLHMADWPVARRWQCCGGAVQLALMA